MELIVEGKIVLDRDSAIDQLWNEEKTELSHSEGVWEIKTNRILDTVSFSSSGLQFKVTALFGSSGPVPRHSPPPECEMVGAKLSKLVEGFATALGEYMKEIVDAGAIILEPEDDGSGESSTASDD